MRTSRLVRALWIEIGDDFFIDSTDRVEARESLVDWNRNHIDNFLNLCMSRLVRALWIEMATPSTVLTELSVEARESLVDWNKERPAEPSLYTRRGSWEPCGLKSFYFAIQRHVLPSRLVRALWIEITKILFLVSTFAVEARESLVDWNS